MAIDDDGLGPATPPPPPGFGVLPAAAALARLPFDVAVLVGYTVRQLPLLVQDVRSTVNDVARLVHHGERDGALRELIDALARAARADSAGALAHALRSAGDLAAVRAEVEQQRLVTGAVDRDGDRGHP
ncbi:hypothetical protein E9549_04510 [Blastococcus sp. MG754426]|uniref:hypothetical protein n=1 Tax=unclassified Blastococcus TaxID=2619396 RepID=UPI001EF0B9F1|nr:MULTISPECIES: hypothetical protein [unclassified Blastococcus]MCF6506669.1 hypothetical protein [Blastococcus sp. MG754426]MCF6511481.1 hypothetical protein [Blastococcus sp. MG754427]MCF6734866.1 hypothetical protein [Blastococcus sp. KM273129]